MGCDFGNLITNEVASHGEEGPLKLSTQAGVPQTQPVDHKLHGVRGSSQQLQPHTAYPSKSDTWRSSGVLDRPRTLHPEGSMRTNYSRVTKLHFSKSLSDKVGPVKLGFCRHPSLSLVRAALMNTVSGDTCIPFRRKSQFSSIDFFSCLHKFDSLYPFRGSKLLLYSERLNNCTYYCI
jgi:hypothetical protein